MRFPHRFLRIMVSRFSSVAKVEKPVEFNLLMDTRTIRLEQFISEIAARSVFMENTSYFCTTTTPGALVVLTSCMAICRETVPAMNFGNRRQCRAAGRIRISLF